MPIKSSKVKIKSQRSNESDEEEKPKKKRGRPPKKKDDDFDTGLDVDKISDTKEYLKGKARKIRKYIKKGENDKAAEQILKSLTSVLVDLLPIAEAKYRKDQRQGNAYALNTLISTTRELAADLQANTDKSVVVDNIIFNILQPSSKTIVSFLIDNNFTMKKELASYIKSEHAAEANLVIDKMSKAYASYFKAVLIDIQDRITVALTE